MKKYALLFLCAILCLWLKAQDPVLMSIGGDSVRQSEFEYLFYKNNFSGATSPKTVEEYLDLYTKFKLKVVDAERLGYDTLSSFKREYYSYRNQLAVGYMFDSKMEESLLKEAYMNLQVDIHAQNILILFPQNYTPEDTLKAYKKAWEAYGKLKKQRFDKVALAYSDDSSVEENKGDMGWITGQMTTYAVERAIYELPIGKCSTPIRTDYGYHIVKAIDRREAVGKVQVAHILKAYPHNATSAEKQEVKNEIEKIYRDLLEGKDFELVASNNSDDEASARQGGMLPPFGLGYMVREFEEAAFTLKEVGELSEPVETAYGWHIIRLVKKLPIEEFDNAKRQLLNSFQRDGRADFLQKSFVDNLKKEYSFTIFPKEYDEVARYINKFDTIVEYDVKNHGGYLKPLFKIGEKEVPQIEFITYLIDRDTKKPSDITLRSLFDKFATTHILQYEDSRLEKKYPAFGNLLREYREGILLFNISNDKVWDKATKDTLGLRLFFEKNSHKYKWQIPHYKGRIIFCKDKNLAKKLQKKLPKMADSEISKYLSQFNLDSAVVDQQRGLWKQGESNVIDRLGFKDKSVEFSPTATYPYVFLVGKVIGLQPETYLDVKAEVVTDYQNFLEQEWIEEIQDKYPVEIDSVVLEQIKQKVK